MSKAVGFVLGVAAVGLTLATGGLFGTAIAAAVPSWLGIAIAGATILNAALMPRGGVEQLQARQAQETTLQIGEASRGGILGKAATAGSLVDAFNFGGEHGTDWEVLVIAIADHRCDALLGVFVDDSYHQFDADGAVAGFNGQLEIYWRPGTEDQTVPEILLDHGPGWTADDNGAGVAHVVVAYKCDDPEAKTPVWSGRPRFLFVVQGKRCYIPRADTSVGGSGDHRWDDPSTWQWTDNLIDCRYNWARGIYACDRVDQPDMLLIGRGLSEIEAPPANTFAPANLCDEAVTGPAGFEQRYRCNGTVYANETFLDVEQRFAAACGGIIVQREGSVEIEPGQAKSVVATITDADILVGSKVTYRDFLTEADDGWVNTVIPRFVDPEQKWKDHAAPIRRDVADVLADGQSREATLPLTMVISPRQAGAVGEIARRMGRLWRRAGLTLGPRFAGIEEGDWIAWTSARRFAGETKVFRVDSYGLDEKWHNSLQLREISSSVFSAAAFIPDQSAAEQGVAPPNVGQPGADAWTLSAEVLDAGEGALPALVIAGELDDPRASQIRFEYWLSGGAPPDESTEWAAAGSFGPRVVRREITGLAPGGTYYAAVSYLVAGRGGDRRILGPATLSDVDLGSGAQVFYQAEEPDNAKLNDLWLRPDGSVWIYLGDGDFEELVVDGDQVVTIGGEPIVFGEGGGWVLTSLSEAVLNAGGNLYFLDDDPPTATKVGDSWFETDTGVLWRWDGSTWIATADRTDSVAKSIAGITTIQIAANSAGATTTPLPRELRLFALQGGSDVSASCDWSLGTLPGGIAATINTTGDRGLFELTVADAGGDVPFSVTFPSGYVASGVLPIRRTVAPPPISGGGGGGGSGVTEVWGYGFGDPPSGSHEIISSVQTVTSSGAGELIFTAYGTYVATGLTAAAAIKCAYREAGSGGSWTDVDAETIGDVSSGYDYAGYVATGEQTESGLLPDTDYEVVVFGRRVVGGRPISWQYSQLNVRQP